MNAEERKIKYREYCRTPAYKEYRRKWRKAHQEPPEKKKARKKVENAILYGWMSRPRKCSSCNAKPGKGIRGQSLIHAHHHNGYEKWWDVVWLCYKCHEKAHTAA